MMSKRRRRKKEKVACGEREERGIPYLMTSLLHHHYQEEQQDSCAQCYAHVFSYVNKKVTLKTREFSGADQYHHIAGGERSSS